MTNIEGGTFENLYYYTRMTGGKTDDKAFADLIDTIMALVPEGTSKEDVLDAINKAIAENPDADMSEILETAVKTINDAQGIDTDAGAITALKTAWETFLNESGVEEDNLSEILTDPLTFLLDKELSEASVKQLLAILYLLMIEIAGEESANQLLESCAQRDEIMEIARQKASELRTKAIVSCVFNCLAALSDIIGGGFATGYGFAGLSTGKDFSGLAMGAGGIGGGFSSGLQAIGGLISGLYDATITELDGRGEVLRTNLEITKQVRQKAVELMQALLNMLQNMSQTDYQTMTAIGRA